jgi:hypothetical protein
MGADELNFGRHPFPNRAAIDIERKHNFTQPLLDSAVNLVARDSRHRARHFVE